VSEIPRSSREISQPRRRIEQELARQPCRTSCAGVIRWHIGCDVEIDAPDVNGRWPEGVPQPSMPLHVLAVLPRLPPELEYRFMNRDLVLWDAHANVIVDYIKRALP
jgi:hypothetical protein